MTDNTRQHPTVSAFNLRTYVSKYEGQTCSICRKPVEVGTGIVNIVPIRDLLRALRIQKVSTFKYCHSSCLPLLVSDAQYAAIRTAVDTLMAETDPAWPIDNKGFDRPAAAVAQGWIEADYPRLGAERMAKHLVRFHGQLDAGTMELVKEAANLSWAPATAEDTTDKWDNGWLKRDRPADRKEVFVGARNGNVCVKTNQWQNTSHEAVTNALRGLRAKWDRDSKCWVVPASAGLTAGNLVSKLSIDEGRTDVAVTERAMEQLTVESEPEPETRSSDRETVGGIVCSVWRTPRYDGPEGPVVVEMNGTGLMVSLDAPWRNEAHGLLKDIIKARGAKWDKDAKRWRVGASALLSCWSNFSAQDVVVTADALAELNRTAERTEMSAAQDTDNVDVKTRIDAAMPEGRNLYPFQYAAVEFIEASGGRALIADEMGTGKTIESLGYLALHPERRPVVMVVPAIVTGNWRNELAAWTPNERVQWIKTGKDAVDPDATVYVITYDMLKKHVDALLARSPKVVVADEVHMVKNPKAHRTIAFTKLVKHSSVDDLVFLSGTPIVNRPLEFHLALSLLNPDEFGDWFKYTKRYCDGQWEEIRIKGGHGATKRVWKTGGSSNSEELNQRLRSLMIRRLKKDVLTELPPKTHQTIEVDMKPAERSAYNKAVAAAGDDVLPQITAARQASGQVKVRAALELLEQHRDAGTPVLVFAHHKDVVSKLESGAKELGLRVGRIDGSVSQERRTEQVAAFQAGDLDCMVLSIRAAGVGITLTRSSHVLFVEQDWTPGSMSQAADRVHRPGQTASNVTIQTLVVNKTVDKDMAELLSSKQSVLDAVLDGEVPSDESMDIRAELVARWKASKVAGQKRTKKGKK